MIQRAFLLAFLLIFFTEAFCGSQASRIIFQEKVPEYVNRFTTYTKTKNNQKIFLMPFHKGYLEHAHALAQDPDIVKNNERPNEKTSLWQSARMYDVVVKQWTVFFDEDHAPKRPEVGLRYVIVDELGGFIGEAGINAPSSSGKRTIFYNIAPEKRKRGYATAVAKVLVKTFKAFFPGIPLHIHFVEGNIASQKVAQRAGFVPTRDSRGHPEKKVAFGKTFIYFKHQGC